MTAVRVLVVDDFMPWRDFVRSTLSMNTEFELVGEASDGVDAVQNAEKLQPDLILLDIGLPTLNGIAAAKRIHQILPGTKILFLTQNNDADVARAALSNGAKGYILKADAERELLTAIEAVLQDRRFVSRGLAGRV